MIVREFLYKKFPKQYGFFLGAKEKFFLPFKIFLFEIGINIFFGNKKQDFWVVNDVFNFRKKKYFVDLAATDGIHESNTFFLEKRLKWTGICIEPNKKEYNKLKKNRNAKCFCEIITSHGSEVEFLANKGIGGIVGDKFDNNIKKRGYLIFKARNRGLVEIRNSSTLASILKIGNAPKVIDYLSLDVEGAEYEVLRNFPFKKYKFLSMTIERPSRSLNNLLFKNGYLFVKNYKVDGFYIHKSLENKAKIKFEKFYQIEKKKW
jgi:hypothetical protein